jgi:GntR family transcriptional repressor for pyruvate dehydrogenase complex
MESALVEMKGAQGDGELGEKADLKFHLALAEASQNQLLMNLMNQVSGIMGQTMKETRRVWLFSKETTVDRLYVEHLAIYEAVKDQNEEAARNLMLFHLENVDAILQKYFLHTNSAK